MSPLYFVPDATYQQSFSKEFPKGLPRQTASVSLLRTATAVVKRSAASELDQEFSQKELAAKSVSLNQLNEQNTSAVRESIVMQASVANVSDGIYLVRWGPSNVTGAHSRRRTAAQKGPSMLGM